MPYIEEYARRGDKEEDEPEQAYHPQTTNETDGDQEDRIDRPEYGDRGIFRTFDRLYSYVGIGRIRRLIIAVSGIDPTVIIIGFLSRLRFTLCDRFRILIILERDLPGDARDGE